MSILTLSAVSWISSVAWAQEAGSESAVTEPVLEVVQNDSEPSALMQAWWMAQWGQEYRSAEALAAAARLACQQSSQSGLLVPQAETVPPHDRPPQIPQSGGVALHDQWLTEATSLAQQQRSKHLVKHLERQRCVPKGAVGPRDLQARSQRRTISADGARG